MPMVMKKKLSRRGLEVCCAMIDNLEHISFIEGLLFYIAMQYGGKETLMEFLDAWGKEYEKRGFDESGGGGDA